MEYSIGWHCLETDDMLIDRMRHKALREYAKERYRRMLDVDHSIDLLKRRSSPPYTMGGIAPFIKEPEVDPIQEAF